MTAGSGKLNFERKQRASSLVLTAPLQSFQPVRVAVGSRTDPNLRDLPLQIPLSLLCCAPWLKSNGWTTRLEARPAAKARSLAFTLIIFCCAPKLSFHRVGMKMQNARFEMGDLRMTASVREFARCGLINPSLILNRHAQADWGGSHFR